jgi:hypothetical protein
MHTPTLGIAGRLVVFALTALNLKDKDIGDYISPRYVMLNSL